MPVTNDKFDQLKIDKLKHFLEEMALKGQARPFEIFVDNLKVVPKTEDIKEFDNYEYYMNEDTEKIRILIYNSVATPRNDQYCFYVQQHKTGRSLNGLDDIETVIQEKLTARDKEYELNRLTRELEETKQQLHEAEEYSEELEQKLAEARSTKYKLGSIDLLDFGAGLLGKFAEKNPKLLAGIGLEGLAGGDANRTEDVEHEELKAHFQKKQPAEPEVAPELVGYLPLLAQLDKSFSRDDLRIVMQILGSLSEEPTNLKPVAELLNIQTS